MQKGKYRWFGVRPSMLPVTSEEEQAVDCEPFAVELFDELPPEALELLAPVAAGASTQAQGHNNPAAVRQALATMQALPVGYVSPLLLEQDLECFDAPDTYSCSIGPPWHGGSSAASPDNAFSAASWVRLGMRVNSATGGSGSSSSGGGGGGGGCCKEGQAGGSGALAPSASPDERRQGTTRVSSKPRGTDEMDELLAVLARALPAGGHKQRHQPWGHHAPAAAAAPVPHVGMCGLGLGRTCRRAAAA
jgi:hypothetical protein